MMKFWNFGHFFSGSASFGQKQHSYSQWRTQREVCGFKPAMRIKKIFRIKITAQSCKFVYFSALPFFSDTLCFACVFYTTKCVF